MRKSLCAFSILWAGVVHAEEAISVVAAEDEVTISVQGAKIAGAIVSVGDRIEIPLEGAIEPQQIEIKDDTVRRVSLVGGEPLRLVAILRHGHGKTRRIAEQAQVATIGKGLRITLRRQPSSDSKSAASLTPASPVSASATVTASATASVPATVPVTVPVPAPATVAVPAPIASAPEPTTRRTWTVLAALLACGALAIVAKRRRATGGKLEEPPLQILASQSLGGKNRIVLMSAGGRELLIAVSDRGARLLTRWNARPARERPEPLPFSGRSVEAESAGEENDEEEPALRPIPSPAVPPSPAIAGLLRLRRQSPQRASESEASDESDTTAADAEWTRELLAAAAAQRGGRS